jgi:RHS repeat-associated protein
MNRLVRLFCAFLLSGSSMAAAQDLGTGIYQFGSFDSRGFDSINIGNLNTHFEIPIVNKQGRGMNFPYSLVYDGLVWSSTTSSGTGSWQPDPTWGFRGQLLGGVTGYLTYDEISISCTAGDDGGNPNPIGGSGDPFMFPGIARSNYTYHDPLGNKHVFNYTWQECPMTQPAVVTGDGSTSDGSGLTFSGQAILPGHPFVSARIQTRSGTIINAPTVAGGQNGGSITDSNGNTITNNGDGTFTDTTGVTALTIGGAGNAGSPLTFTYPVTLQSDSATSATATVHYNTYTVETNFQCSGIVEYGANSIDLIDHITLPDAVGSTYSFTYEPTLGIPGHVTGRLASITLPTGGTIAYSYTDGCNGSGINPDGTVGSLKRTTTYGARNYVRSPITGPGNATSTTVQDESGNQTLYAFSSVNGFFYETHRAVHQGTTSGITLLDRYTCYNGASPDCTGAVVTPPFAQTIVVSSYNGNVSQDSVVNTYDGSEMLTGSTQGLWGQPAVIVRSLSYNSLEEVTGSLILDGSGNLVSRTTYGYDETASTATSGVPQHSVVTGTPGNQTSSSVFTGTSNITTTTAYYDTGVPISTATPNGTTQFTYDATQTFVTQTTLPTPSSGVALSTSATYDPQSGAPISVIGMNSGQTAQVLQYDRLLRPAVVNYPNGGQTTYHFTDPNTFWTDQPLNGTTTAHFVTRTDGYGRLDRTALYTGNDWYQVDYCFDATGRLQFQSARYEGSGFSGANANKQCSGSGTSYAYDALGRVTSTTTADGTAHVQYGGRAVETTDVNGVQKIIQHDLLGRITGICEISSNSSMPGSGAPANCNMDIAGTGFLTSYTYDLANHKTTITQGAQTRTFTTDAAGRPSSISEPERGTTNYSYAYNSTGLQVTRTRPQANQTNASVTTTTLTQYDSVGRILRVNYSDGTPQRNYQYDAPANWAILSPTNVKGMLSFASVNTTNGLAISVFSYNSMGKVNAMAECLPFWCGNSGLDKRLDFNYDLAGNLTSASDGGGTTTSYSYSPAGEVGQISSSMNDATHPGALVSNVVQGPNGPISYSLGNGLEVNRLYDSMGRLNGGWVCSNTVQPNCSGGSQTYGFTADHSNMRITAINDTALNQHIDYGYDEFNRLNSTNINNGQQMFSYVYDRYGNRTQQNAPQGGPAPSYSVNTANNQISSFSYDAAGNLTSDGFHTYIYDAEGNIIGLDGYLNGTYVYNALNQRVQVDLPTVSRQYLYNASGQRVSVWDSNTHAQAHGQYYWSTSPIAYYDSSLLHFQHQDWMGTERLQTSYNGGVEGTYASLPWGDAYGATGSDNDRYHFAQLDRDSETDTHHAQFRQYSPAQGRWMSPDPYDGSYDASNPQSLNRYSYALNNPLRFVDPRGLFCEYEDDAGDGLLESVDYNSSSGECASTGGDWYPDGYITVGGNVGDGNVSVSGGISGTGGTGGGGSQSSQQFQWTPPNNVKQQTQQCVSNFYNSNLGTAVKFGSPLSLLPGWNPTAGQTLKEWATAIIGKGGGVFGSGMTPGTNSLVTLSGETTIGSTVELWAGVGLGLIEKAAPVAMGAATLADIGAHGTCAMQADPAAANAALQSIP